MVAKLKRVEIENFKSFRGLTRFGPLKQFSVVIGPNGSGKSNFMDAVSFAACVETSYLRAHRLSHLAHSTSTSDSRSTAVTIILELNGGVEMHLTRRLVGNVSKYMIDQQDVTKEEYLFQLKELGISEYFFIFQGASQDLAMKKPKELVSILEAISGSVSFKEKYENLNNQLQAKLEVLSSLRSQKKIVDSEFKNLKIKVDNAVKLEEIHLSLMKNIDLPFVRGSLGDVSLTSSSSDTSAERTVLRSDEVEVDFSSLTEEDTSIPVEDFDSLVDTMESEIQNLEIESSDPLDIAQVTERMNMWKDKVKEISSKLKAETAMTNYLRNRFDNIKRKRYEAFMACFKHVSSVINDVYKDLMQSDLCHAMLTLENEEEPYLGGVQVCFVEHGKPCISMTSLSGGESVMAGLALTFALHSFLPSPLLIFDEVDDALDTVNIDKLVRYINCHKDSMQITVITQNKKIANDCDVIVGICPDPTFKELLVTKVIMLNLSLYPKNGEKQLPDIEKCKVGREIQGK